MAPHPLHPRPPAPGFGLRPLHPHFAAEVTGLDLGQPIPDATFAALKAAFDWHLVLVFRDQHLSAEQHVAFSRRFGRLEQHPLAQFRLPDQPEILVLSNEAGADGTPRGLADAGRRWHGDLSWMPGGSRASLAHARLLPDGGAETLFASQILAHQRLAPTLKARIAALEAEHDYASLATDARTAPWRRPILAELPPPAVHRVVRRQPQTGRSALFVNERFTTRILGVDPAESDALLQELFAASAAAPALYRHQWRPHDLVLWDNVAVIHRDAHHGAIGPLDAPRRLHRTTVGWGRMEDACPEPPAWCIAG